MPTLYSYVLPFDNGSAPNPFWGVCTLVICKPVIRRTAQIGDWVVGTGSAISPIGNIRDQIVYVMQITDKMPLWKYDAYTKQYLPNKIPQWSSSDPRRRAGDSLYDFSYDPSRIRKGVHDECNRERDQGGKFALLSEQFYYFGDQPVLLPEDLRGVIKRGPGHQSRKNDALIEPFLVWLESLGLEKNRLYGQPQEWVNQDRGGKKNC